MLKVLGLSNCAGSSQNLCTSARNSAHLIHTYLHQLSPRLANWDYPEPPFLWRWLVSCSVVLQKCIPVPTMNKFKKRAFLSLSWVLSTCQLCITSQKKVHLLQGCQAAARPMLKVSNLNSLLWLALLSDHLYVISNWRTPTRPHP